MSKYVDLRDIIIIAPNFKQRLSGVTSTIIQLIPEQRKLGQKIATLGPGLPDHLPSVRFIDLWRLWQKPQGANTRVWHSRRNVEMLAGIVLRDVLQMKLNLIFTSAAQRRHKRYTRWLISKMDKVITTTDKAASYLDYPSTTIHHGVDLQRFKPCDDKKNLKVQLDLDPNTKLLGCFGRVRHQKGTDLFVEMLLDILPQHPKWAGVITGRITADNSAFADKLKAKIKTAGLSERIIFAGEVDDVTDWFRAIDIYIAPQRWEGFGLTPLEAAACGVPSIATDVGAFSEIITPGKTGEIVEIEDLVRMITYTQDIMNDDQKRQSYGKNARLRAEQHFALEHEATKIGEIYNQFNT